MKQFLILAAFGALVASSQAQTKAESVKKEGLQRLLNAYPNHIKAVGENHIEWLDGTKMTYDDGKGKKAFKDLLDNPDIEDQFVFDYTAGVAETAPARNHDPGRIRYEPFFFKMYGNSKAEVQKNLTTITWMPKTYNVKLQVTKVNDVHKKMEALSAELDARPEFHKYLANPGGTFNWRKIAGTNRQSTHSFGTTIDINVDFSNYWRWAVKDATEDSPVQIIYKNRIPLELVAIFEKHGFIWGGKWYHYDTMHFEYRPELLPPSAK
jgi:peptidoglycan LD-endopeptidase CwlK